MIYRCIKPYTQHLYDFSGNLVGLPTIVEENTLFILHGYAFENDYRLRFLGGSQCIEVTKEEFHQHFKEVENNGRTDDKHELQ